MSPELKINDISLRASLLGQCALLSVIIKCAVCSVSIMCAVCSVQVAVYNVQFDVYSVL